MSDMSMTERLALYRLLVEQANVIATARRESNRFFLTFNTTVFGGLGLLYSNHINFPAEFLMALAVGMVVVSAIWFFLIGYYGRIARAKFQVVFEVEKAFDIQPFAMEERKVWQGAPFMISATTMESLLPALFSIGYAALAVQIALSHP